MFYDNLNLIYQRKIQNFFQAHESFKITSTLGRRDDWCFMCELQNHVYKVRHSQNAFSPLRILSRIRNISNHLGYGRQEDAHEFMR